MYKIYRNGGGPVADRIRTVVTYFYQHNGELPACILVDKAEVREAKRAVRALALRLRGRRCGCIIEVPDRRDNGNLCVSMPHISGAKRPLSGETHVSAVCLATMATWWWALCVYGQGDG